VRVQHVAIAGLVTVVVSLSWMTVVSLVPAGERPYVDGTLENSVFAQVFEHNGIARLESGQASAGAGRPAEFLAQIAASGGTANHLAEHVAASWHRLLNGLYGRDIGWLVPAAVIAAVGVLLARRRRPRRDLPRTFVLLWGTWLLTLWVFFSGGIYLHSYYVAALAPAIAALCGTGAAVAWSQRGHPAASRAVAGALIASLAYGVYLLRGGVGVPGWLVPLGVCLGVAGALAVLASGPRTGGGGLGAGRMLAAGGCALMLPAVASALMVTRGLGPFSIPYEPASVVQSRAQAALANARSARIVERISATVGTPYVFAVDTSELASGYILASGREILPIGGFEGGIPAPTVEQLRHYISSGKLGVLLLPTSSKDPRLEWVYAHCKRTSSSTGGKVPLVLYDCRGAR
jgi:4-amino-4-deoxy-L-arabinose transferase-like glycosyltransferase